MRVNINLRPWIVPNFVTLEMPPGKREDGWKEAPTMPLSDLDAETLSAQCDRFREAVFEKAGKKDRLRVYSPGERP